MRVNVSLPYEAPGESGSKSAVINLPELTVIRRIVLEVEHSGGWSRVLDIPMDDAVTLDRFANPTYNDGYTAGFAAGRIKERKRIGKRLVKAFSGILD